MKNNLLKYSVLILSICLFSTKIFSQSSPNPGADPLDTAINLGSTNGIESLQPASIDFKGNNGEKVAIDRNASQVRLSLDQQPAISNTSLFRQKRRFGFKSTLNETAATISMFRGNTNHDSRLVSDSILQNGCLDPIAGSATLS